MGIGRVIPAAGTGKKIYINRCAVNGTSTGTIHFAVYDGYSTVLWDEIATTATEKTIDFGSFGLVGSANAKMVLRMYSNAKFTAGYIRCMGYTR